MQLCLPTNDYPTQSVTPAYINYKGWLDCYHLDSKDSHIFRKVWIEFYHTGQTAYSTWMLDISWLKTEQNDPLLLEAAIESKAFIKMIKAEGLHPFLSV